MLASIESFVSRESIPLKLINDQINLEVFEEAYSEKTDKTKKAKTIFTLKDKIFDSVDVEAKIEERK